MDESHAVGAHQIQQLDSAMVAQLLARHYSLIFNRCLRMLGHRQDAEDATQETFSRAIKYIHRWDPRRPLEPWLMTIAGNRCRTHLSQRRFLVSLSDSDALGNPINAVAVATEDQAALQDAQSLREEVDLAVSQLSQNHRLAFELFHQEGMSYAQIAQRLGCPPGTAKTWVHRARTSLMARLHQRDVVQPRLSTVDEPTCTSNLPMPSNCKGASQ